MIGNSSTGKKNTGKISFKKSKVLPAGIELRTHKKRVRHPVHWATGTGLTGYDLTPTDARLISRNSVKTGVFVQQYR